MVRTFIREKKIFCGDHYREVDIFGYTTAQKNAAARGKRSKKGSGIGAETKELVLSIRLSMY